MTHNALRPWESVLVRHQLAAKHGKIAPIESMLAGSFETTSSVSTSGNAALANMTASGRWVAAGEIGSSSWISLNSNVGTAEQLFNANCKGRRTEVVWAGKEPGDGEVVLCWVFARIPQLTLRGHASEAPEKWQKKLKCTLPALTNSLLKCSSIAEAFDVACKHLSLKIPAPYIGAVDKKFVCIGASGKPVTKGLKNFHIMSASGLSAKDSPAAVKLAKAIEAGDVSAIKKAIAAGAPLDALPETSHTPLESALLSFDDTPNWRECCQALIDAGCAVEDGNNYLPLHMVFANYIPEEMSIELGEFLLSNGASINSQDGSGFTILYKVACARQVTLVEFLLKHGADPKIITRDDKSIIDEIRERYDRDLEYSNTSSYRPILELLTGSAIEEVALPPAAIQEGERFLSIAKAEFLLSVIPEAATLKRIKTSRLAKLANYSKWTAELKQLGFEEAAHCTVTLFGTIIYSAFVHPKLGFDAVLSDDGPLGDGTLRIEIAAYHSPQRITTVTNKTNTEDPNLKLTLFDKHSFVGASPSKLVNELKKRIKSKSIQTISVDSFIARFEETLAAMLADYRNAISAMRSNPIVLPSGDLPRFERMGVHIKVKPQEEAHECSSFAYVTAAKKSLERSMVRGKPEDFESKPSWYRETIHDTAMIAAVNHLQMAAGDNDTRFYPMAIDAAVALYGTVAAAKQAVAKLWGVNTLAYGLTLASLMQNWDAIEQMSAGIGTDFANPKHRRYSFDEPVAIAQWQVLFTNRFRTKACPKSKQFRDEILKGRSKQAKSLLAALDAVDAKDPEKFSRALQQSIEAVDAQRQQSERQFDVYLSIAWNESVLWMIARREGMTMQLTPQQFDFLMTGDA